MKPLSRHNPAQTRVLFHRPRGSTRRGLSLFEVLLALAIFVGALAALSQLLYNGMRGAVQSKLRTEAVFRCESKLGEVIAGALPFQNVSGAPFEDDPAWNYSVTLLPGLNDQLFTVQVTVEHPGATSAARDKFSLTRLVRDPQIFVDALAAQEAAAAAEGESSSSGSN